jgi:hypothetical protein
MVVEEVIGSAVLERQAYQAHEVYAAVNAKKSQLAPPKRIH